MKLKKKFSLKLVCLLVVLMCGSNPAIAQMDYYTEMQEMVEFFNSGDKKKCLTKGKELLKNFPDSMAVYFYCIWATSDVEEDEDEYFLDDLLDSGDVKFGNNYDWLHIQASLYEEWEDYEEVISLTDSMLLLKESIEIFRFQEIAFFLLDLNDRTNDLIKMLKAKQKNDKEYKQLLIRAYADIGILDSAQMYLDEIFLSGKTDMEDYRLSAFIKYRNKDNIGACMDLDIARKKGYLMEDGWVYRLNCYHEDRRDPKVLKLIEKHQDCKVQLDGPEQINRKSFIPKGIKKVRISRKVNDEDKLGQYEILKNTAETISYSYFEVNEGPRFYDTEVISLCSLVAGYSGVSASDTVAVIGNKILPHDFVKCEPVTFRYNFERFSAITYLGYENIENGEGNTNFCAKFRVAHFYNDEITFVAYYWFADGLGWIAKEDSEGDRVDLYPIK